MCLPRAGLIGLVALLLVGGGDGASERESRAERPTATADSLDALAMESGALPDQSIETPVGRYGRRYEGGVDRLCIVPEGEDGERYRFGAEMLIGGDEYCRGAGEAEMDGDMVSLRFEGIGEGCTIKARYEGDRLVMPGQLGMACNLLCSSRGTFAGTAFPRMDRDGAAAAQMRDANKALLCR